MLEERDLTTDQLLDGWRQAEIEVNGTSRGTKEHDDALRRLIRRNASAGRASPHGGPGAGHGRRGHSHTSWHRTTGK